MHRQVYEIDLSIEFEFELKCISLLVCQHGFISGSIQNTVHVIIYHQILLFGKRHEIHTRSMRVSLVRVQMHTCVMQSSAKHTHSHKHQSN